MGPQGQDEKTEERVLILAPIGKDAPLAAEVLTRHGFLPQVCGDVAALWDEYSRGAGVLFITEEALLKSGIERLAAKLDEQPAWSDIPVLVCLKGAANGRALERLVPLRNVSVFERPVRLPALISGI